MSSNPNSLPQWPWQSMALSFASQANVREDYIRSRVGGTIEHLSSILPRLHQAFLLCQGRRGPSAGHHEWIGYFLQGPRCNFERLKDGFFRRHQLSRIILAENEPDPQRRAAEQMVLNQAKSDLREVLKWAANPGQATDTIAPFRDVVLAAVRGTFAQPDGPSLYFPTAEEAGMEQSLLNDQLNSRRAGAEQILSEVKRDGSDWKRILNIQQDRFQQD
jgi:hypothetical protein